MAAIVGVGMSLTPLDEQQRGRAETARDGASPSSILDRVRARVGSLLDRIPVLGRPNGSRQDDSPPSSPPALTGDARRRPLTDPRGGADDTPRVDLDCRETDERLTISHPDNAEASISSDTYESVEP